MKFYDSGREQGFGQREKRKNMLVRTGGISLRFHRATILKEKRLNIW